MSEADDYAGIMRAYSAYSIAVDRGRWDLLREAFAEDGVWEMQDGTAIAGVEEIIAAQPARQAKRPKNALHVPANILISVDGDRAQVDSDWLWYGAPDGVPWQLLQFGYYDDQFVRTPAGWRIAYRKITRVVGDSSLFAPR